MSGPVTQMAPRFIRILILRWGIWDELMHRLWVTKLHSVTHVNLIAKGEQENVQSEECLTV